MPSPAIIKNHVKAWFCYLFLISSWAIFSGQKQPFLPVVYNMLSLVVVFYAVRWMAARYWRLVERKTNMFVDEEGLRTYLPDPGFYLRQWPFLGVIAIALAYIGVSWIVDGFFVATGHLPARFPDFYYYCNARWNAETVVVLGGNVMAAIEHHFRKQKIREKVMEDELKRLYAQQRQYNNIMKETIDALNQSRNRYNSLAAELQQRINRLPPGHQR